jgi:hypothetical protein
MTIKINYNDKIIEYEIWQNPETKVYFVNMTEATRIPIEIVKNALEEIFNIKITKYTETLPREYAKNHPLKKSGDFCYYFMPENGQENIEH